MTDKKPAEKKARAFDPSAHFTDIKGRQYLEVKWRIVWFREEHPEWVIGTDVNLTDGGALAKCNIATPEGKLVSTGTAFIKSTAWPRFVEKAETAAVGRALALLGYGTQFAEELDEDTENGELADSPVGTSTNLASEKQVKMIRAVARDKGKPTEDIEAAYKKKLAELTSAEASAVIERLMAMPNVEEESFN